MALKDEYRSQFRVRIQQCDSGWVLFEEGDQMVERDRTAHASTSRLEARKRVKALFEQWVDQWPKERE